MRIELVLDKDTAEPLPNDEGSDNKKSCSSLPLNVPKKVLPSGNSGRLALPSKNCITCLMLGLVLALCVSKAGLISKPIPFPPPHNYPPI